RGLESGNGEGAAVGAPARGPILREPGGAAGGERREAGLPTSGHLVTRQRLVGHRDRLVVAGNRVPAVVGTVAEQVDLVVAVGSVLDRPQGAVGALRQALHVAVAPGVDVALHLVLGIGPPVLRPGLAGEPVESQRLPAVRREVARVGPDGGIA